MTTKYPTITIRLPQHTIDWLNAKAKEYDMTKSEMVREALHLYNKTK